MVSKISLSALLPKGFGAEVMSAIKESVAFLTFRGGSPNFKPFFKEVNYMFVQKYIGEVFDARIERR